MGQGLSLFLNITAGDLASKAISKVVDNIKKMGDASDAAGKKFRDLEKSFKLFSASALAMGTMGGKLVPGLKDSANLDMDLVRIRQTAGYLPEETAKLRKNIITMAELRGTSVENLMSGLDVLSSKNMNFDQTLGSMTAINEAMAVTGADAGTLANALTVAAQSFKMDLTKPGEALKILQAMTAAGRAGSLELEDLAAQMPKFASNAVSAGFNLNKVLALAETFSKYQPNTDMLGTLVNDTMKMWTNGKYMENASKASGVSFFDKKGMRRSVDDVMGDMSAKYKALKNDASKQAFITKVFGIADQGTIDGWKKILTGDIAPEANKINKAMIESGNLFAGSMEDSMNNATVQAQRLRNTMRGMTDELSMPINKAFASAVERAMLVRDVLGGKDPDKAGAGVMGTVLVGGAAMTAGFGIKALLDRIGLGKLAGNAVGMTAGKAMAEAAGITPVYVTNFGDAPGDSGSGMKVPGVVPVPGINPATVASEGSWLSSALGWGRGALAAGAAMIPGIGSTLAAGVGTVGVGAIAGSSAVALAGGYALGTGLDKLADLLSGGAWTDKLSDAILAATNPDAYKRLHTDWSKTGALPVTNVSVENKITVDTSGNTISEKTVTRQTASGTAKGM